MAAPQQQGQSDGSASALWTVAGLFALLMVIWYSGKQYIVGYFFKLKLFEIDLISHFTSGLEDTRTKILTTNMDQIDFSFLIQVGQAVGAYLRIPAIIFILILAILVFTSNKVRTMRRIYDMKALVTLEKNNWPQISPVANLNLIKADIDKGPWAMAMTPMQFCKRHHLLEEYKKAPQEGVSRKEWSKIEVRLKRGPANQVFATQLGPLWYSPDRLPMHTKALFAIFGARMNSDPSALEMLRQLSRTAATKLDFSGVEALLKKHVQTKIVQQFSGGHAYVLTVMASMLEGARTDGVQASSDFLWLKPLDRRLWYTLNTVGRQTPFPEVAGIFAHWVSEKEIGKKLLVPMVEEATNALEQSLKDILYRPDEA